jgi:hypothetical protein
LRKSASPVNETIWLFAEHCDLALEASFTQTFDGTHGTGTTSNHDNMVLSVAHGRTGGGFGHTTARFEVFLLSLDDDLAVLLRAFERDEWVKSWGVFDVARACREACSVPYHSASMSS